MSNFPTIERTGKPDWEQSGKCRRRSDTLRALRSRVSDEVLADARLWINRWELSMNGYCDAQKKSGGSFMPGDVITFNALRGKAWRHISEFRSYEGEDKHILLVHLLADCWSFTAIGYTIWPKLGETSQRHKASDLCATVLEELHDFWMNKRKESANQINQITKLYESGISVPELCKKYQIAEAGLRGIIEKGMKNKHRPKHLLTAIADK